MAPRPHGKVTINPFFNYMREVRSRIELHGKTARELVQIGAQEWRTMDEICKERYRKMARNKTRSASRSRRSGLRTVVGIPVTMRSVRRRSRSRVKRRTVKRATSVSMRRSSKSRTRRSPKSRTRAATSKSRTRMPRKRSGTRKSTVPRSGSRPVRRIVRRKRSTTQTTRKRSGSRRRTVRKTSTTRRKTVRRRSTTRRKTVRKTMARKPRSSSKATPMAGCGVSASVPCCKPM